MTSLDFDQDAFYICTETSPRCFVVQKAIQMDRAQLERMMKSTGGAEMDCSQTDTAAPPAPPLPQWFTRECRDELMNCQYLSTPNCKDLTVPPDYDLAVSHVSFDLKEQLKAQLEYYFSRENLMTDRYLRCQMDQDQFVPISIIAGFRKIVSLTNDYNLIVQVLRESSQVEVDEKGERVRPVSKRCTIILREIDQQHKREVESMLSGGPEYISLRYGLNNSWYVTYDSEEKTQRAYLHLQSLPTFNDKPICARIKAGAPPSDFSRIHRSSINSNDAGDNNSNIFDLGKVLASLGYIPRATYRPGATVVRVCEDTSRPPPERNPRGRGSRGTRRGNNQHTARNQPKRCKEEKDVHHPSYSFEENSFPSLFEPKPPKEEKLSFSTVAAGRKKTPRKSYAETLAETSP